MNVAHFSQLLVQGLLLGGIYGLIAIGLSLIFGVMGVINFAHGQMMVMAMYVSYWIFVLLGIDPYISLIITAAAIFALGYFIQSAVVNRILDYPEAMQVLPLVAAGLILENMALLFWGPDHRSPQVALSLKTFWVGPVMVDVSRLVAFALAITITILILLYLRKTRNGLTKIETLCLTPTSVSSPSSSSIRTEISMRTSSRISPRDLSLMSAILTRSVQRIKNSPSDISTSECSPLI